MQKEDTYRILEEAYFGAHPHEQAELESLPSLMGGVEVFVDIGASLGQYTAAANRILSGKRIVCVEPDPIRFERLNELVKTQFEPFDRNEIEVVWGALSERSGEGEFFTTDSNVSGSIESTSRVQGRSIRVPHYRLDDLVKTRDNVFLKMDVEGAEYLVLKGAPEILATRSTRMLVELHPWGCAGYFPDDTLALLSENGFDMKHAHSHHYFFKSGSRLSRFRMRWEAAKYRLRRRRQSGMSMA